MKSVDSHSFKQRFIPSRTVPPGNSNAEAPDSFIDQLVELRRPLYRRALFLAQDRTAAEDLIQETMEKALHARHRFLSGSNLGAWLFSIMRNLFIDGRRRRAVHGRMEQNAYWLSPAEESTAMDETPEGDLPCGLLDLVAVDDVMAVVAALAPAQREIFTLAYIDRLTYRDIARRLGIPVSTTGTRLLRVRAKVRARLQGVIEERWRGNRSGPVHG
jgi:RNA polymerase sigma-70 factor (ECF subfamily)